MHPQPREEPEHAADDAGEPARLGAREGHRDKQRGECRRAEQVTLAIGPTASRLQLRRRPRRQQRERRAVAAAHERIGVDGARDERTRSARAKEHGKRRDRAVAALEQPAEDRDREDRHERVHAVHVCELVGEEPPPVPVQGPEDRRPQVQFRFGVHHHPGGAAHCHQRDRRIRSLPQRARRAAAGGRGQRGPPARSRRTGAGEQGTRAPAQPARAGVHRGQLGCPPAQAAAAVGALGDVGTHLRAALLANHEQVSPRAHRRSHSTGLSSAPGAALEYCRA